MKLAPALGVFGGTFDPVHFGHLRAASEVKARLGIDDFRLLPAGSPPHRDNTYASAQHRLQMLRLAVADHPDLAVDAREVLRQGESYMVDTLAELRDENPRAPLLLFIGQDAINGLDRWHQWKRLFELAHIVVMTRPQDERRYHPELREALDGRVINAFGALKDSLAGQVLYLDVTKLAISSTRIRRLVADEDDPRFLLPDRVLTHIRFHRLYRHRQA